MDIDQSSESRATHAHTHTPKDSIVHGSKPCERKFELAKLEVVKQDR